MKKVYLQLLMEKWINAKSHLERHFVEPAKDFDFSDTSSKILRFWHLQWRFCWNHCRRVQKVTRPIRGQGSILWSTPGWKIENARNVTHRVVSWTNWLARGAPREPKWAETVIFITFGRRPKNRFWNRFREARQGPKSWNNQNARNVTYKAVSWPNGLARGAPREPKWTETVIFAGFERRLQNLSWSRFRAARIGPKSWIFVHLKMLHFHC